MVLQIAQAILSKGNKVEGIITHDLKQFYKTIEVKIEWYWHKTDK
jgi:hypothetical protein